jgi:hypothetical protein
VWQVDSDRVLAAIRGRVLQPGERIDNVRVWPEALVFDSAAFHYTAEPAPWLIAGEPWVDGAVRVVADRGMVGSLVLNYGLVLRIGRADALFLNEVDTMRDLGRRLGIDLDPIAYAELLGVLYSGRKVEEPVVHPFSATRFWPPGVLVRDVDEFLVSYPFADPALVAEPVVRDGPDGIVIEFYSCHYYLVDTTGAIDILHWRVAGGRGQPAAWSRRYVVERLERPIAK